MMDVRVSKLLMLLAAEYRGTALEAQEDVKKMLAEEAEAKSCPCPKELLDEIKARGVELDEAITITEEGIKFLAEEDPRSIE